MKCPNCGAETRKEICEFCGSEMPKPQQSVNITNNYYGESPAEEKNESVATGKCPKCGSSKISFKRERVGSATVSSSKKAVLSSKRKGQAVSQSVYRTIGICQNCGYTWNPNGGDSEKKSSGKTWLWVLGWICIFPLPLTIILLRKKNMKPAIKYGIIAVAWLIYIIIAASGVGNSNEDTTNNVTQQTVNSSNDDEKIEQNEEEISEVKEEQSGEEDMTTLIDDLVEEYNLSALEKLTFTEDFTPNDKRSGHYRVEFRLGAYDNAIGKSYVMGDKSVDLICTKTILGGLNYRVYSDGISLEQAVELIEGMSPLMDNSLSADDIANAVSYVNENKEANGYYYGKLGLLLLGSDAKGYDLMIKLEK